MADERYDIDLVYFSKGQVTLQQAPAININLPSSQGAGRSNIGSLITLAALRRGRTPARSRTQTTRELQKPQTRTKPQQPDVLTIPPERLPQPATSPIAPGDVRASASRTSVDPQVKRSIRSSVESGVTRQTPTQAPKLEISTPGQRLPQQAPTPSQPTQQGTMGTSSTGQGNSNAATSSVPEVQVLEFKPNQTINFQIRSLRKRDSDGNQAAGE